jgi:outer membrane usher protein FimD/PapC
MAFLPRSKHRHYIARSLPSLKPKPIALYPPLLKVRQILVDMDNIKDAVPMHGRKAKSAGYVNYDFFASPQDAYGNLAYGMRLGSGIAQVSAFARPVGDDRGIMLSGFAWRRQSESGNTLLIGDAQSRQGKYEESLRFDGVQYVGQNLAYDAGWQRTDFGDSAMHLGQFLIEASAWRPMGRLFTLQTHLFADSTNTLLALGGAWTTPRWGQVSFGIAPASAHGVTGFFGYALNTRRVHFTVDDRTWAAQSIGIDGVMPGNYRQLKMDLQYVSSPATKVHLGFGTQTQGGFNVNNLAIGYAQRVENTDLHVDFTQSGSSFAHSSGLVTYFSLPLGNARSLTAQNVLTGGYAAKTISFKQDSDASGLGTSYALEFGQNGRSFSDATITAATLGSTAQVQLSRMGGPLEWSSEFSGSIVFFGGAPFAAGQMIDQSTAFDTLKGRSSAMLTIVNYRGRPLSAGSIVRAIGEDGSWRIAEDGRVSLDDLTIGPQTLLVSSGTSTCVVGIVMPPNVNGSYDLGRQICR